MADDAPARTQDALACLIRRLQDGDKLAFEPLILQTQASAFRLAHSIVADKHLAEDVLQEVYMTVYRDIRTLRDPSAFRTWLARIVTNRCKKALKGRKVIPDEMLELREESSQWRVDLKLVLDGMSLGDRTVLALREIFGCTYDEISTVLKVPLGTVKSRLAEARRRMLAAWTR